MFRAYRGPLIAAAVGALLVTGFAGYALHDCLSGSDTSQSARSASASQPTATAPPQQPIRPAIPPSSIPVDRVEIAPVADPTVYVTRTGSKYHRAGCRYLSSSMIPMKLSAACLRYAPCSVCGPPVGVSKPAPEVTSGAVPPPGKPLVAENSSRYGEISPATGRPKTVHVRGYYRKDGTYVRGHYRSPPSR